MVDVVRARPNELFHPIKPTRTETRARSTLLVSMPCLEHLAARIHTCSALPSEQPAWTLGSRGDALPRASGRGIRCHRSEESSSFDSKAQACRLVRRFHARASDERYGSRIPPDVKGRRTSV